MTTRRPRLLLDLFCGGGGAAMGYARAGWDVVGVDVIPQPSYPFEFRQADAIDFDVWRVAGFRRDSRFAALPSVFVGDSRSIASPDLYRITREGLERIGLPWVIENVIGAPYRSGVVLCGSSFDLTIDGEWLRRHRNFESSEFLFAPPCAHPKDRRPITISGHARVVTVTEYGHSRQAPIDIQARLMGIAGLSHAELVDAIPPAYTEWIGAQLIAAHKGEGWVR